MQIIVDDQQLKYPPKCSEFPSCNNNTYYPKKTPCRKSVENRLDRKLKTQNSQIDKTPFTVTINVRAKARFVSPILSLFNERTMDDREL